MSKSRFFFAKRFNFIGRDNHHAVRCAVIPDDQVFTVDLTPSNWHRHSIFLTPYGSVQINREIFDKDFFAVNRSFSDFHIALCAGQKIAVAISVCSHNCFLVHLLKHNSIGQNGYALTLEWLKQDALLGIVKFAVNFPEPRGCRDPVCLIGDCQKGGQSERQNQSLNFHAMEHHFLLFHHQIKLL